MSGILKNLRTLGQRVAGMRFLTELLLLLATTAWGFSFIWVKQVSDAGVDANAFLVMRYGLAALLLIPFSLKELSSLTGREVRYGLCIGALMYIAMRLQTAAMAYTTPANSAFITTAYVVLVPFTGWLLLGQRPGKRVFLPVLLCVAGLYILNLSGGERLTLNIGNAISMVCAVAWAFQVSVLSRAGSKCRIKAITIIPIAVVAVISCFAFGLSDTPINQAFSGLYGAWTPIILCALFPTLLAGAAQTYAQRRIAPTKAAMIYSLESVFACIISVFMGFDSMSSSLLLGGSMIVAAILLNELSAKEK